MNDELWLKELAQVNRDKESDELNRLDERWDRLSAGELSPEEEAELRALAETSEEARDAYEAFRPLGADFQAGVVQAIRNQGPKTETVEPVAKVVPFHRRNAFRIGLSTMAAVAAAALFFVVRGPSSYAPLPVYTAELSAGDQTFRGGTETAAGVPVFSPGSTLTLNAFPEQAVTGSVEARVFAKRGAELVPLELRPNVENGSVLLKGTLGQEIRLPPGESTIWIVVGRPGKIPSAGDLQEELRAGRTRHDNWQAMSAEFRVEERQASP